MSANKLGIRGKIRLSIGMLGFGFVLLLLLVQWTGMQAQKHMDLASHSLFPASLSGEKASAAFQKLGESYSNAVLVQDKSALEQADESVKVVDQSLESIERNTAFNAGRQKQVIDLKSTFNDFHSRAEMAYSTMIERKGSLSQELQQTIVGLAHDKQQLESRLRDLREKLASDFQGQLDTVSGWWKLQRVFGMILFLLVACCATLATIMVERRVSAPLYSLTSRLKDIAEGEGDLTQRIPVQSQDEIGELSRWFNTFLDKLQEIMCQIKANTLQLATASEEIASTAMQMAQGSETQQNRTTQVAASMHEMASSVTQISENAHKVAEGSRSAAVNAREGGRVVDKTVVLMRTVAESVGKVAEQITDLGTRSDQIGRIVNVIDEIADQTNLLALNAAIEAARAGEQGRGFAVVADEVRKLAERTAKATKEIAEMITSIQSETKTAVQAMQDGTAQVQEAVATTAAAGAKLQQIIQEADSAADMTSQIATAGTEQSRTTEEINASISDIARISQESANGSRQSAKACEELSRLAFDLQSLVSKFKVADNETRVSEHGSRDGEIRAVAASAGY